MKLTLRAILCFIGVFTAFFISAMEKIDINTATQEELMEIIHIGNARALDLIALRPFSSLDDLIRIKGISEKRVEDIKNQGLAWIGDSAAIPESKLASAPEPKVTTTVAIAEPLTPPSQSKFPVPLALATAIFSGAIILILKRK